MPTTYEIADVPADEVERVMAEQIGATKVTKVKQKNGKYTVRATYPDDDAPPAAAEKTASRPDASEETAPSAVASDAPMHAVAFLGEVDAALSVAPEPAALAAGKDLTLSAQGARLIQAFESCERAIGGGKFRAYYDPVGVLTIGWGHTNHSGRQFTPQTEWTQAECDQAFLEDMHRFEAAVRETVTVALSQNQFDALVSFTFNCGEGNLRHSTLLKKVNSGDFAGAAEEFLNWTKAGGQVLRGLVRRRASESLMFQGIPDLDFDGKPDAGPAAHAVDAADAASLRGFGLDPAFQEKLARLIEMLRKSPVPGLDFRISQGLRSPQKQARYYCQWARRSPQEIDAAAARLENSGAKWLGSLLRQYRDVPRIPQWQTNALPGAGWHQWGEAADCYCYRNGKRVDRGDDPAYRTYATAAQSLGLTPGLYFSTPDAGHVQLRSQPGATSLYRWDHIDRVMQERFGDKPEV